MNKTVHTLYICTTCRKRDGDIITDPEAGKKFYAAVQKYGNELKDAVSIVSTECLGMCKKACSAALSGDGKYSYLLAHLDESMAKDLCTFAHTYAQKMDGLVKKVERPEVLQNKVQGRLPPIMK